MYRTELKKETASVSEGVAQSTTSDSAARGQMFGKKICHLVTDSGNEKTVSATGVSTLKQWSERLKIQYITKFYSI